MPDNPNKKGKDGKRISQQPHEQAYQRRKQNKDGTKGTDQRVNNGRGSKKAG